ncbi:hypothetical protein V8E36_001438 [Tilletia maclaganii]
MKACGLCAQAATITIEETTYDLVGRLCAQSERGDHFTAFFHLPTGPQKPRPGGVYYYNDMSEQGQGLSQWFRDIDGTAEEVDLTELLMPRPHSVLSLYVARSTTAMIADQVHAGRNTDGTISSRLSSLFQSLQLHLRRRGGV